MSDEMVKATAEKLVAHCRAGTTHAGLDELYDADCVSVEAMSMGGEDRVTRGLDGIRGKHDWWSATMEVHSATADGPYLHENRFSVIFEFDATNKETGTRRQDKEVAIYTVNEAGRIVREEFYYPA